MGLAGLALAGLLVWAVPPAGPAHAETGSGSIGIRLVDAPVDRADDPRAHSNIVDHLPPPGDVIERRVEVVNDTDGAVTLPVYVGGAELEGEVFRPSLPAGTWHAEVALRSGTVERGAEGELVVPERRRGLSGGGHGTVATRRGRRGRSAAERC